MARTHLKTHFRSEPQYIRAKDAKLDEGIAQLLRGEMSGLQPKRLWHSRKRGFEMGSHITISPNRVEKQKGVVILPLKKYQELLRLATPTYYVTGGAGINIDALVLSGLKELAAGRTKKIKSLADLD